MQASVVAILNDVFIAQEHALQIPTTVRLKLIIKNMTAYLFSSGSP